MDKQKRFKKVRPIEINFHFKRNYNFNWTLLFHGIPGNLYLQNNHQNYSKNYYLNLIFIDSFLYWWPQTLCSATGAKRARYLKKEQDNNRNKSFLVTNPVWTTKSNSNCLVTLPWKKTEFVVLQFTPNLAPTILRKL